MKQNRAYNHANNKTLILKIVQAKVNVKSKIIPIIDIAANRSASIVTNINETNEHIATQHQDKKFQCTKWKKKFTAKRNLKKHVQHCRSLVSALLYSTKVLTFFSWTMFHRN